MGGVGAGRTPPPPRPRTWGQSPLGSCFLSRQRTPRSRASTSGCLGEGATSIPALSVTSHLWLRPRPAPALAGSTGPRRGTLCDKDP